MLVFAKIVLNLPMTSNLVNIESGRAAGQLEVRVLNNSLGNMGKVEYE